MMMQVQHKPQLKTTANKQPLRQICFDSSLPGIIVNG
jgi:hypothetical protein